MTEQSNEVEMIRVALQEATSAARTAEASANALSLTINGTAAAPGLKGRLEENTTEIRHLTRRTALQWLTIALVALLIGLGAWSYIEWRQYQECRNSYTSVFLDAERAKVSGQIVGIRDRSIDEFVNASQHYLDTISKVPVTC